MSDEKPTVPYGYCHCGCGQKTTVVQWGAKKGPRQFRRGHSGRGGSAFSPDRRAELVRAHRAIWEEAGIPYGLCLCGCGASTSMASISQLALQQIKGEPKRYVYPHGAREARKAERIRIEDRGYKTPCHIWLLKIDRDGYGREWVGTKEQPAHRAAWERVNGHVPSGLQLDHLCRVRSCVNPDHVEPVTSAENVRRGNLTSLTAADVQRMRSLGASGLSMAAVARKMGLPYSSVTGVLRGRSWRDV